ncbi:WXG100 family type VII secretion target [Mycobacterium sp. AZCC_0083]|uniref:WXG100 family type VII secretion target n=1 Tax=Mycobacterium sp. AZCC_0083 TaxID=2735882 RepID=UPI00161BE6EB|nr:WXG100 family type VII secretion target [Mycobacterium sp. AZCC_0083]MBB5163259.1 WXG100 family type VII secretion target [Mycobacterium sp. AZCC_0083]
MSDSGSGLATDSAVLIAEASNFDTISTGLQGVMGAIDGTQGAMSVALVGQAGTAAHAAFVRYQEAAQVQKAALDEIVTNLHGGGVTYDQHDGEQSGLIGQTVNLGIHG